jgi:hypothetical protein
MMRMKIALGAAAALLIAGSALPSQALDWTNTMQERGYEAFDGQTALNTAFSAQNARAQATVRATAQTTHRASRHSNAAAASALGYGPYPDRPYGDPGIW